MLPASFRLPSVPAPAPRLVGPAEARLLAGASGIDDPGLERRAAAGSVGQQQRVAAAVTDRLPGVDRLPTRPTSALDTDRRLTSSNCYARNAEAPVPRCCSLATTARLASHFDRVGGTIPDSMPPLAG